MKLIYLSKNNYNNRYRSVFRSNNIVTIHYKNPLKAIDNLNEIEPNIFYMVKDDFPRFWKIVLSGINERFKNGEVKFFLYGTLDDKEAEEFHYLKGTAHFEKEEDFIDLLKNFKASSINTNITNRVYFPEPKEINLGFVKQNDFSFVNCSILEMTENEILVQPENSEDIEGIKIGDIINNCSLSIGDEVITVDIRVINIKEHLLCSIINEKKPYSDLMNRLFV